MHRDLAQLARREYDVLVIGGGIYGVCIAWDAILRGLSVALVEKGDFGHATSANSLRVIHGGLRYLQHADLHRMRLSMREQRVFMHMAPHLVHPLPVLLPTYGHLLRGREMFSLALLINRLVGWDLHRLDDPQKHLPHGRVISKLECLRLFPGVEARSLTGGVIVYDCQMSSSERLVLGFVQSAIRAGADLRNYVEVTAPLSEGDRLKGVQARDVLTGDALAIRARIVVNASGPWMDWVLGRLNGHHAQPKKALSKAFNLLINPQLLPGYAVGVYGQSHFEDQDAILHKGSQLLFITPWHNRSLIGTAHLPYDGDPDDFHLTEEDIEDFLLEINKAYPTAGLKRQHVCSTYGGLLPASGDRTSSVQLVKHYRIRDHGEEGSLDGLISVVGVKFTEARYVADKVVDLVFKKLGKTAPKSTTAITPLHGGQIQRLEAFVAQEVRRRSGEVGAEVVQHLISRYGSAYPAVLKYLGSDVASGQPLTDMSLVIKAEVLHGVREEMAVKLADVIFRRTALGMAGHPGDSCLRDCARIMAQELGWSSAKAQSEVEETRVAFKTSAR